MISITNKVSQPHAAYEADDTLIGDFETYEAALEAVINAGGGSVDTAQSTEVVVESVTPEPEPEPLEAVIALTPSPSDEGMAVTLDGTQSTGDIVSYNWDDAMGELGQWPLGEGAVVVFTFSNPGTKQVRLTVTDSTGAISQAVVEHTVESVTVEPEPDPEPTPDPDPEPPATDIPGPSNTGPRKALTPYSGRMVVTEPGAVVEGYHVNGYIDIKADNVTIRDCYVEYNGDAYAVRTYVGFKNTTVEHTKITCAQSAKANGAVMGGSNTVVRYCDISGHADGIKAVPNGTYEYNWIHMSKPASSDKHLDAIQGGHNNTLIRHNVLWVPYSDGGNAAYINTTFADTPPDNVVITDNWIAGGTFAVYVEPTKKGDCMTNVEVSNNRFAPTHRWGRVLTRECDAADIFGNTDWVGWEAWGEADVY